MYVNGAELGCTYQDLFGYAQMQTAWIMSHLNGVPSLTAVLSQFALPLPIALPLLIVCWFFGFVCCAFGFVGLAWLGFFAASLTTLFLFSSHYIK